jgi:N-acetylmuramoyl-L-alanine amidase
LRRLGIVVVVGILISSVFAVRAGAAAAPSQACWALRVEQGDAWADIEDAVVDVLGQPFVIVRALASGVGAHLSWIEATKEAVFTSDRTVAVLKAGNAQAYVNGEAVALSAPPDAESGRMAVAASDIGALGLRVAIDGQSRIIRVSWPRSRVRSASVSVDHGVVAVMIEADASFRFSDFVLRSPDRLVIDIFDAVLEPGVSTVEIGDEVVARVRAAMNRPGVVRVVVDLASPLGYAIEYAAGAPARLIIRFNTRITGFLLDGTGLIPRLSVSTVGRSALSAPQVDAEGTTFMDFAEASVAATDAELLAESGPVKWVKLSAREGGGTRLSVKLEEGYRAIVRDRSCDDGNAVVDFALAVCRVEWYEEPGCTVVDIATSGPVDAKPFRLKEPSRLVVDLPRVWAAGIPPSAVQSRSVEQVRLAQFTEDTARAVLDLGEAWAYVWEALPGNRGIRLRVGSSPVFGRTVLIDPGHGGTDPGSVRDGVFEKDLNLDMALKLKQLLAESGAQVVMTRDSDCSVQLSDRSRMANELMPDAVISIHCNSTTWDVFPSGTETYYCNAVPYSQELAALTHTCVVRELKLMDRKVRRGDYHVVRETCAPAILVEVGFMSNGTDLQKLRDSEFRQKAALGMFNGLSMYLGSEMFRKWRAEQTGRADEWWYVGEGHVGEGH